MTDEKYVFRQTEVERKRSGRGAFYKKNGRRSKKCTLPSDRLTAKQRKELNGKMETYNLNKPMTWTEFLQLPYDLQEEYLTGLINNYSARRNDVAMMFGIQPNSLSTYIAKKLGGKTFWNKASAHSASYEWLRFVASADFAIENVSQPTEDDTFHSAASESVKQPEFTQVIEEPGEKKAEVDLEVLSGALKFTGDPYAIFTKALLAFDTSKRYSIYISFEQKED